MRATIKDGMLIVVPETGEERAAFVAWRAAHNGHVFHLAEDGAKGAALSDLGQREEACREPINIAFDEVGRNGESSAIWRKARSTCAVDATETSRVSGGD